MDIDRPASPLELESEGESDVESAIDLGGITSAKYITEAGSALKHRQSGRTYHTYDENLYMLPNDEAEQNRLNLQHQIFRICVNGALCLAPIPKDGQKVLDVGCGTGIWTVEFAHEHPSTTVLGVDLSAIQPDDVPVNCSFSKENIQSDWTFEGKFDFIHSRAMIGAISSWPQFFARAFEHLNPGGYLELQDVLFPSVCYSPAQEDKSKFVTYSNHLVESATQISLDLQAPLKWRDQLQAVGFIDIHIRWVNWPIGPWAKHTKNKVLGRLTYIDFIEAIESSSKLLVAGFGWEPEKIERLILEAKNEMREQKVHLYQRVAFCYAKKPGSAK